MAAQPPARTPHLAAAIFAFIALIGLGDFAIGCNPANSPKAAAVPKSCPEGAELMGSPPPNGTEIWCEKYVGGIPVKDGAYVVYNLNGSRMIDGYYRDGKQSGEWTMWHGNGQRASVDHYTDGVQNGMHTSWYPNGAKAIEGAYRDGKREGVWHRWDPNGFKEWTDVYKDDEKVTGDVTDGPGAKVLEAPANKVP
jgi:hypothetical protein